MLTDEILKLARDAGFKVDWQHADVAEIKAQRYVTFARAIEAAVLAKLRAQSEPVAWMTPMGNVFAKHQLTEAQKADLHPLYTHPAPVQQGPVAWLPSAEWTPCYKLPVTVHVRKQREGETHISTREGITPVKPDDLIMRGVQGEEYPIGREIFEHTYHIGEAQKYSGNADFWREKCKTLEAQNKALLGELKRIATFDYKLRPTPEDLRDVASAAIATMEWQ